MRCLLPLLVLAIAACSGGDGEPVLLDDEEIAQVADRVAPQVSLTDPPRGQFVSTSSILVTGTVIPGSAPITQVLVNGTPARLSGQVFEADVVIEPGPNIIGVRAEAEDEGRAVDAVTVFGGMVHPPNTLIENAVHIHLGREFLDDDEPDLDDISGIVAQVIADEMFLGTLTAEPFMVGDDTITVTRINVASSDVDLVPETNCVDARMSIQDTEIDMTTTGIAAILGEEVYVTVDAATVELLICGTETPGQFEVVQSDVTFDNLILATNENPDLANDLPSTHATLVNILESALNNWLGSSLGGFLTDLMRLFQLDYTFGSINFAYTVSGLSAHPDGLEIFLSGTASSPLGLAEVWQGTGSLRTDDPGLPDDFSTAPIAVAMSDDALNQLLFAYWYSGSIADYELDPAALEQLPEVFQPLSSFDVELGLPPTLIAPLQPEFAYDLAVGEVRVNILAGSDRRFDTGIHLRSGANIVVDETGGVGMQLDGRAQKINVQANVAQSPATHEPGDVAALLRLIVPSVLGAVDVNYGGFPLPDFQLSAFSENVAAFQGRSVRLVPSGSRRAGEGGGHLVIEGALSE